MIHVRKRSTILTKTIIALLLLGFALSFALLSQNFRENSASAANTLNGINEVITINDTTDSLPVNNTVNPYGYSGDGNVILFYSTATNLPDAGSTAGGLYIYNIKNNNVDRIDISTSGVLPNGGVFQGAGGPGSFPISENGRYVTFASQATNLIDDITKAPKLTYKRDTQTGTTTFVGGGYTGGDSSKWDRNLAVSNDGRFSLILSRYLNSDYPYGYKPVLGDNQSGSYTWTNLWGGYYGDLSCDGAFAVSNQALHDLRSGTITAYFSNSYQTSPIISCNGRYVLYATTDRTQITPTPTGMDNKLHLIRYDRITGERMYVDSNSSGTFSGGQYTFNPVYDDFQSNVFDASIADTGDIVFEYKQTLSATAYSYIKHLSDGSGTLEPIAKTLSGSYINVQNGVITSDGRYIFFQAEPFDLGIGSSPQGTQIIRAKTNI